jgi:hypothetical protein
LEVDVSGRFVNVSDPCPHPKFGAIIIAARASIGVIFLKKRKVFFMFLRFSG